MRTNQGAQYLRIYFVCFEKKDLYRNTKEARSQRQVEYFIESSLKSPMGKES